MLKLAKYNKPILILVPVIFFVTGLLIKSEVPFCFLFSVDPDYFYLFNGLNIANFHLPWMIDHPGTPLQAFCAIVIRLVHLFRPETLERDLFLNPELYLNAIRFSLILFHTIVLFLLGFLISVKLKNTIAGVLIQLTPFASYTVMNLMPRLVIESFFISTVMLFILVTLIYVYSSKSTERLIDKYLILFSLLAGINLAVKLTFLPLCLIPFILLPGWKKIIYVFFSIISFGLFAFPIFDRWVSFRNWVLNMLTHSGNYGGGKKGIIDLESYKNNISIIVHSDYLFVTAVAVLIISCIVYHFKFLRIKRKNDFEYKALVAFTLGIIFMILLISKMMNYWYLTPALLLIIPGIFLVVKIMSRIVNFKYYLLYYASSLILILIFVFQFEYNKFLSYHPVQYKRGEFLRNNSVEVNNITKNAPLLICTYRLATPFKEYGLYCGALMCGGTFNKYCPILNELYPSVYVYHTYWDNFLFWNENFKNSYTLFDILRKRTKVNLMFSNNAEETVFMARFNGINRQVDTKFTKIYERKDPEVIIYSILYDSLKDKSCYKCDAEKLDSSKTYFLNENGQRFDIGGIQSNEKSKSGEYSNKLDKNTPEGFSCTLSEVNTGDHFSISVWKYDNKNSASNIRAVLQDSAITGNITENYKNWVKLKIDVVVTKKFNGKNIKIFCFNQDQVLPAFFDDLEIKKE